MRLRTVILLLTHSAAIFAGFVGGLYTLPIITAPPSPTEHENFTIIISSTIYS